MVEAATAGKAALKEVHDSAVGSISEALDSLTATQHQKLSDGLKILCDTFTDAPPELEGESPRSGSSENRNG